MSTPRILQRIRAKKPAPAAKPTLGELKSMLDTSANTNRNLFIAFNALLVTALTLCLSISDEQLLVGNLPVRLPIINIDLPIWAFASVMPMLLLAFHFDLLHNLNEHCRKLQAWVVAWEEKYASVNASNNGERELAISDQLYPFMYDFAWLHAHGKGPANISAKLRPALCWALYCWAPYTVLMIYFIRFAALQSYSFTAWHLLLIVLDVAWIRWYWQHFGRPQPKFWLWRWVRKVVNLRVLMVGITSVAGCWTLALSLFIHLHLDMNFNCSKENYISCPKELVNLAIKFEEDIQPILDITLVPRLVVPNFRVTLGAKHFEIAKIMKPEKSDAQLWANTAIPLDLRGRRFGFANFSYAVMSRVDFTKAKLKAAKMDHTNMMGAIFTDANLQGADLSNAEFQGVFLRNTALQGANLSITSLRGAILQKAQLQCANLNQADLHAADLREAQLQCANLRGVQFQGTVLHEAQCQDADLRGAQVEGFVPDNTTQNVELFTKEWLKTACSSAFLAETMIMHDVEGIPAEITDAALRDWIKNAENKCTDYEALAEKAIKNRAIKKATNNPDQPKRGQTCLPPHQNSPLTAAALAAKSAIACYATPCSSTAATAPAASAKPVRPLPTTP